MRAHTVPPAPARPSVAKCMEYITRTTVGFTFTDGALCRCEGKATPAGGDRATEHVVAEGLDYRKVLHEFARKVASIGGAA